MDFSLENRWWLEEGYFHKEERLMKRIKDEKKRVEIKDTFEGVKWQGWRSGNCTEPELEIDVMKEEIMGAWDTAGERRYYCPLSMVRKEHKWIRFRFHYRADVPLGFFDPLHFRKIRYSCASTQRVLVFYLHGKDFGGFEQRKWRKNRTRSINKEWQEHCTNTKEKEITADMTTRSTLWSFEFFNSLIIRKAHWGYVFDQRNDQRGLLQ